MSVGLVTHPAALAHDAGDGHPERADRLLAITAHLEGSGLRDRLIEHQPDVATLDLVGLAHAPELVELLEGVDRAGGGRLDQDTRMGPGSLEAALRGSQGAVDAAQRVLAADWSSAVVLMRPPGHHATADRAMGFCLTNHVAVAARWAVRSGAAARVAIVDWDAHHGNGTQDIFWSDGSVLYASMHQYPWYPGSGDADEVGDGAGYGTTLNIPLPAGTAEDAYLRAFEDVVVPEVRRFAPDLVLVSAGYDAHERDPLCMMRCRAGAFFRFTRIVADLGPGPVCVLEGGYDLDALAWSTAATVSALLGDDRPDSIPPEELEAVAGTPDAGRWIDRVVEARRSLRI